MAKANKFEAGNGKMYSLVSRHFSQEVTLNCELPTLKSSIKSWAKLN